MNVAHCVRVDTTLMGSCSDITSPGRCVLYVVYAVLLRERLRAMYELQVYLKLNIRQKICS